MKNNLMFAAALLACTPLAFAQAPSGDLSTQPVQMAENQMAGFLNDAPPMASVVAASSDVETPQGPSQDGPQVQPPPPPPQQGHGPQGVRMHGRDGGGPGGDRGMEHGIIPPGPWWQNPETVAAIGLSADQQKHIEDLFVQSRTQLIQLHATLETEQLQLEPVLNANPIDQSKALAVIDRIANSRAELEKADAKMLLSIRGVLTPDQWTKLQAQRPHGRGPRDTSGERRPGDRHQGPPAPPTEE